MAIDIDGFSGLPVAANPYAPRVLPRRNPVRSGNMTHTMSYLPANRLPSAYNDPRMQNVIRGHARMGPSRAEVLAHPNAFSPPQYTGVNPFQTPFQPMTMPPAPQPPMPTVLPQSRPPVQGPPAPQMGVPDFVRMKLPQQQPKLVTKQPAASGGIGGLLGGDFDDPKTQANLAAAAALLDYGAPSVGAPKSLGGAFGKALGAYQDARTKAMAASDARKDSEFNRKYKQSIMDDMERKRNMPTTQFLADGAFSAITDPITGEVTYRKNEDIAAYIRDQAKVKSNQQGLTKAEEKIDEKFAGEYIDLSVNGGFADIDKGLQQLNEAIALVADPNKKTSGTVVQTLPRFAQSFLNEDGLVVQDLVAEVTQRNLRAVLGGQFAQKEGEQLIARAYDPLLSDEANLERLKRLEASIRKARDSKQRAVNWYETNGTLKGFKGNANPTMDTIAADAGFGDYKDKKTNQQPSNSGNAGFEWSEAG